MRDRGIVLDPYLDHDMLVRVCKEVGVPVEELDPSSSARAQVSLFGNSPYSSGRTECIDHGNSCCTGRCAPRLQHLAFPSENVFHV